MVNYFLKTTPICFLWFYLFAHFLDQCSRHVQFIVLSDDQCMYVYMHTIFENQERRIITEHYFYREGMGKKGFNPKMD